MRWIGLNDGYVSADGLFFVAPVTVQGKRGDKKRWVVYGQMILESSDPTHVPWTWTTEPLFGPSATKRDCQDWALESGYTPRVLRDAEDVRVEPGADRPSGYEVCVECCVHFTRHRSHRYEDYCGANCYGHVVARVAEIRSNLGEGPA